MILRNKPATNAVFSFEAVSSRTITGSGGWAFPNRRATATGIIAFGCDSGSIDPPRIEIKTFNDPGGLPRWKTTVTAFISGVTLAYDSGWTTLSGGGFPTETVLIEIDGLRVKNRCGSTSQLIWSELRVRRNGTVVSTLGANTSTFSGYQFRKSFYQLTPELYTVNFPNIAKTGLSAPFDVTHYGSNGGIWTAYNGCDGEGACPPRLNNCRTYADAVAGSEVVNCLIKGGYTDNSGEAIVFETPLMGSVLAGSCDNVISYPAPSVSDPTNIVVEHKQTMNWSGRLDEANESCTCPAIDGYSIAFQLPRIRDKWRETKDWENVRSAIMLQRKETGPIARSTYRYTRCTPNLTTLVSQVDNLTDTDTISRVDLYRWVAKHERWCERVTQTGTCIYSPTGPGYPGFTSSPSCPAFPTPTSFYTEIGGHSVWRSEPTCTNPPLPPPLAQGKLSSRVHAFGSVPTTLRTQVNTSTNDWARISQTTSTTPTALDFEYQNSSALLLCAHVESDSLTLRSSADDGATFTTVMTIGTAVSGTLAATPAGLIYIFRLYDGTIYSRTIDAQLNTVRAEEATNITDADDGHITARYSVDGSRQFVIVLTFLRDGAMELLTSADGVTFA